MTLSRRVRGRRDRGTFIRSPTDLYGEPARPTTEGRTPLRRRLTAQRRQIMTDNTNLSEGPAAQPIRTSPVWTGWSAPGRYPAKRGEQLSTSGPKAGSSCCSMSTSAATRAWRSSVTSTSTVRSPARTSGRATTVSLKARRWTTPTRSRTTHSLSGWASGTPRRTTKARSARMATRSPVPGTIRAAVATRLCQPGPPAPEA